MPADARGRRKSKAVATAAAKKNTAKPRPKPKQITAQDEGRDLQDEIERLKGVVK
jgi:hypothetical protein